MAQASFTLPDGSQASYTVPDDWSQEQVLQALGPHLQEISANLRPSSTAVASKGFLSGLSSLPETTIGAVGRLLYGVTSQDETQQGTDAEEAKALGSGWELAKALHQVTGPYTDKPANTTPAQDYLYAGAQGAGAAVPAVLGVGSYTVADKIANALRIMAAGGTGGLTGEAAVKWNPLPDYPSLERAVGNIAGGAAFTGVDALAEALGSRLYSNQAARSAALSRLSSVTPDELEQRAQTMQDVSANHLVDLNAAQAGVPGTALDDLVGALNKSSKGGNVQAQLLKQPAQFETLGSQLTPAVGFGQGVVSNPGTATRTVQKALDEYIGGLQQQASANYKNTVATATPLSQEDVGGFIDSLDKYVRDNPGVTSVKNLVSDIKGRLRVPDSEDLMTNPDQIKRALTDAFGPYVDKGVNSTGAIAIDKYHMDNLRGLASDLYAQGNGAVAAADRGMAAAYNNTINPVREGVVGRVLGNMGDKEGRTMPESLFSVFDKGTVNPANSDILTLADAATQGGIRAGLGNTVFPDAVSTYVGTKLANIKIDPKQPLAYADNVYKSLMSSRAQEQGLRDMVIGSAKAFDATPEEITQAVNGVDKIRNVFAMGANVPTRTPGIVPAGMDSVATQAAETGVFGVHGAFVRAASMLRSMKEDQINSFLNNMLTTPEGVRTLAAMGREQGYSPTWGNLFATALTAENGATQTPTNVPSGTMISKQEQ